MAVPEFLMMLEEIQKDSYWRKASKRQPVHFQKGGKRVCQHSDTSPQVTVSGRSWQTRWFLRCLGFRRLGGMFRRRHVLEQSLLGLWLPGGRGRLRWAKIIGG